jgi:hypothetical protein
MAITPADQALIARKWVEQFFVGPNVTANLTHADIVAAAAAFDAGLDATNLLNAFLATDPLITSLAKLYPAPFSTNATVVQKYALACYVFMKRAGVI